MEIRYLQDQGLQRTTRKLPSLHQVYRGFPQGSYSVHWSGAREGGDDKAVLELNASCDGLRWSSCVFRVCEYSKGFIASLSIWLCTAKNTGFRVKIKRGRQPNHCFEGRRSIVKRGHDPCVPAHNPILPDMPLRENRLPSTSNLPSSTEHTCPWPKSDHACMTTPPQHHHPRTHHTLVLN
jgi:hypothetical protein